MLAEIKVENSTFHGQIGGSCLETAVRSWLQIKIRSSGLLIEEGTEVKFNVETRPALCGSFNW